MTVEAYILHRLPGRVRLKIPDRIGDPAYFAELEKQLPAYKQFEKIQANPETGSLLLTDGKIDLDDLSGYARENDLFVVSEAPAPAKPLSDNFMAPVASANAALRTRTAGRLDLAEIAFLLMMGFGIFRLVRGKFSAPPWYTAFWYAYGISKILLKNREKPPADDVS
jgi:hypothetical protein